MSEVIQLKGGFTTTDPRLDRLPQFDERSRNFRVRTLLEAAPLRRRRTIGIGPTLDQGNEGACVGFSCTHAVNAKPFAHPGDFDNAYAREVYFGAQRLDYWEGGAYPGASPFYEGSSVLGGMKSLQERGLISSYSWIGAGSGRAIDDLVETARHIGSVVMGLNWYMSCYRVDGAGVLTPDPDSGLAGGHAITVVDAVTFKPSAGHKYQLWIVMQNSWSTDYGTSYKGQGGFVLVDPTHMEAWLEDDGEGAVPLRTAA